MEISHLQALRLGFSTQQASYIKDLGLSAFVKAQLNQSVEIKLPDFLINSPKNLKELKAFKEKADKGGAESEKIVNEILKLSFDWKSYVLKRCYETKFPLQEKINLFLQNHFVVTLQTVKLPYWVFLHYKTIHTFSLKNYKELIKEMVYSNAMIKYLDNQQNKIGNINENLGRELLELFTLGEGNYTEEDIKNVALSLAGLTFGDERGEYRAGLKDNSIKTVFGKKGNFDADAIIELIMQQKNTPYFFAEKALKWFFYDQPTAELVKYYGDYFKENNFELKVFFEHLFINECQKNTSGTQIKNPLIFLFQIHNDLNLKPNYPFLVFLLKSQSMDIYDQPNVKGWKGGNDWLTSQIYENRKQLIDFFTYGNEKYKKQLNNKLSKFNFDEIQLNPKINITNNSSADTINLELTERMIFQTNEEMLKDLNQILKYDFDVNAENANQKILNVFNYLAKSPEFQII